MDRRVGKGSRGQSSQTQHVSQHASHIAIESSQTFAQGMRAPIVGNYDSSQGMTSMTQLLQVLSLNYLSLKRSTMEWNEKTIIWSANGDNPAQTAMLDNGNFVLATSNSSNNLPTPSSPLKNSVLGHLYKPA
ncbi:hypothetical protein QJS04_geneDACA016302 [Acorus gramineus]|uniref:Uncharacterized protein n=1 Tax=Acorus gramineus TaxID=55184 RepID=A0AAV9ASI1_ACOGR|nr:hypothetical protein QJS04_geneDACA016302 [Acorus gramineus]